MNGYFYILTTIDIFVLCFMCVLTRLSESLNKKQKRGFLFAFGLIALISLLEVVTLKVDGLPKKFRWINIVSNYLVDQYSIELSRLWTYAIGLYMFGVCIG